MAAAAMVEVPEASKLKANSVGLLGVLMQGIATIALSPGRGGFSFAPLNPYNAPAGGSLFVAIVFSIFAYSGWEAVAPLAEESKDPRRTRCW